MEAINYSTQSQAEFKVDRGASIQNITDNLIMSIVQGDKRNHNSYTDFDGKQRTCFYFNALEIVQRVQGVVEKEPTMLNEGQIQQAHQIIEDGHIAIYPISSDPECLSRRARALSLLADVYSKKKKATNAKYKAGVITEGQYKAALEPILGSQLSVAYELDYSRFDSEIRKAMFGGKK